MKDFLIFCFRISKSSSDLAKDTDHKKRFIPILRRFRSVSVSREDVKVKLAPSNEGPVSPGRHGGKTKKLSTFQLFRSKTKDH